jgi:EpsI family protein
MTTTVRCCIIAICLLLAAGYLAKASRAEELPPRVSLSELSMRIGEWNGRQEAALAPDIVKILGVDEYLLRTYTSRSDRTMAGLYIGYHDTQRQGDTIHSPLNCLPGAGWQPLAQNRVVVTVPGLSPGTGRTFEVNDVLIGKGLDRQVVLYWYQSHRRVVASEYWGKIYTVVDAVRYNRTDAALVRVVVPVQAGASAAEARERGVAFVQTLFPLLERHLPS